MGLIYSNRRLENPLNWSTFGIIIPCNFRAVNFFSLSFLQTSANQQCCNITKKTSLNCSTMGFVFQIITNYLIKMHSVNKVKFFHSNQSDCCADARECEGDYFHLVKPRESYVCVFWRKKTSFIVWKLGELKVEVQTYFSGGWHVEKSNWGRLEN